MMIRLAVTGANDEPSTYNIRKGPLFRRIDQFSKMGTQDLPICAEG
jgi:hypothetical protein